MFIKKTAAADIETMMEKNLVSNAVENEYSFNKIEKAADFVNAAAEIFDDVGMTKHAEVLTALLESIAKKKKSKKQNKNTQKNLTSEKMVKNLKEKGWVFNSSDHNCADDNCAHDYEKDEKEADLARMMHMIEERDENEFEDEESDYEPCASCGFDHEYGWSKAQEWHRKNPDKF